MPVRFNKDGEEEYSFRAGDYGSRDFARLRRFGGEDPEDARTMSLVSSPLQVPLIGQRRNASPSFRASPGPQQLAVDEDDFEEEIASLQRADPPRRSYGSYNATKYDRNDDFKLEPLVPTYQPRVGRSSQRYRERSYEPPTRYTPKRRSQPQFLEQDDEEEYDEPQIPRHQMRQFREFLRQQEEQKVQQEEEARLTPVRRQKPQHDDIDLSFRWRKRGTQEPAATNDVGYVVPPLRKRVDPGLQDDDEQSKSVAAYLAKRKQFAVEDDDEMLYYKNPNYQYRMLGGGDRPMISNRDVEESIQRSKLEKAPMFDMKLRSHVVWEKMNVKFTCTVRGHPMPRVTWYKDMVPLEPSLHNPGKYKISNNFGLHSLEICRASIEDSGTYRVSLQNRKGEISSYATLVVRRYDGGKMGVVDMKSGYNLKKPTDYPDVEGMDIPGYPRFVVPLYGKVVDEGQAMIITCEVDGEPLPEVFWTLNGRTLDESSSHIQTSFDGKQATLTILKVYTDDEGEYCCRAFNSCGAATSRCYVRVRGLDAPPSAPSCVEVVESNRDYVMLSWKAPGYIGHFGGAPVSGYIIETAEAGSSIWKAWNRAPVKLSKTPVTGLGEGKVYFFRVRAITRWGKSMPSLPSGPVGIRDVGTPRLPMELQDPASLLPPETDEVSMEDEEKAEVLLPGTPTEVTAALTPSGDVVNVGWKAPSMEDGEVDGYLIECCLADGDEWKTMTSQPLQTTDPYPVTGLTPGQSYRFRVFAVNVAGCSEPSECSTALEIIGNADSNTSCEQGPIKDIEDIAQQTVDCRDTCENGDACMQTTQEEMEACSQTKVEDDELMQQQTVVTLDDDVYTPVKPKARKRSELPSAPVDVKGLNATREYIEIGWTPPFKTAGEDPVYYVEMKKVGDENWSICNQAPIGLTHYPILGVESGESYEFRVRAVTSKGTSEFSETSDAVIATDNIKPPNWWGGVQGLIRVADEKGCPDVTKHSVKICWDAPTTDGGSAITGYFVEYRPAGGKFRAVNNKPLTQRHFTVDGLNEALEYEFRVRACNVAGCGDWKMLPGRVLAKDPEPPTYPTNLLITAVEEESVSLQWKRPSHMGDAKFIGYIVERCKEGSDIWIPCNKMPEDIRDEKYKVDGLVTGQTYFFRVRAANRVGISAPSLMSCFVTPGEEWALVEDRQNAMIEMRRLREEEERARRKAEEEAERRQAFVSGIEKNDVPLGGRAYYECTVKDPNTQVKWCLGNEQEIVLEPVGKYDIVHVGTRRSLMISDCQYSDIQLVSCVALYNGCTTSAYCIVDGKVPVKFIETTEDVYTNKGQTAQFTCTLTMDLAKVCWYKNGIEIDESDERYEILSDGNRRTLILKNVAPNDVAEYTVGGFGGSHTAHLVVDGILPAKFTSSIHGGDYDHEETEAVFDCVVTPSALYKDGMEPECAWYHNGERIEEGDEKYQIVKEGNKRMLKILDLSFEDSGEIVCRCGGDETSCEINVERPPPPPPKAPVLQKEDAAINFLQGLRSEALTGSIRLYCVVATLRPDVEIFWYRDDVELDTTGREYSSIIDRESGLVSLVFNNITPDLGSGTYTCEFITSHLTFDTKVNFTFASGEYEEVMKEAMALKQAEEKEKQARLEERKRKRAELKKKREEEEKKRMMPVALASEKTSGSAVEVTQTVTSDGITYKTDVEGNLILHADVSGMTEEQKGWITWMKNSVEVNGGRMESTKTESSVQLTIKDPETTDAGTYTCKIKTRGSSTEMSADITGNVFKGLLAESEKIRSKRGSVGEEEQCTVETDGVTENSDDVITNVTTETDDVTDNSGDVITNFDDGSDSTPNPPMDNVEQTASPAVMVNNDETVQAEMTVDEKGEETVEVAAETTEDDGQIEQLSTSQTEQMEQEHIDEA